MTTIHLPSPLERLGQIGVKEKDDNDLRFKKRLLVLTTLIISLAGIIWGLLCIAFNEYLPAVIPFGYTVLSMVNLWLFSRRSNYRVFSFVQLLLTVLLPAFLMLALGGYINGSATIVWSFLAPLGALLLTGRREARWWFVAYLVTLIVAALLQPILRADNNLSPLSTYTYFVLNIGTVSVVAFTVITYFVGTQKLSLELMENNLQLKQAYLEQEMAIRQNEKLATLGKLSAGVAHEINNPGAAVLRGSEQLVEAFDRMKFRHLELVTRGNFSESPDVLQPLLMRIEKLARNPLTLDALDRSDREYEIETALDDLGVEQAWDFAPTLVKLDYQVEELRELHEKFGTETFCLVVPWLHEQYDVHSLMVEIHAGAKRISEIVAAMKSYSYMDQADLKEVDLHEGIENTLVILRNRLKSGVTVNLDFDENVPCIQAYGSELNQVWTNIIDNAIDAMDGQGVITISTRYSTGDDLVHVTIEDNGPGIPPEVLPTIFDPFVTTKPVGEGTGMGLNMSHNIVVQKHKGRLSCESEPGRTVFTVCLPLNLGEPEPEPETEQTLSDLL